MFFFFIYICYYFNFNLKLNLDSDYWISEIHVITDLIQTYLITVIQIHIFVINTEYSLD